VVDAEVVEDAAEPEPKAPPADAADRMTEECMASE
jgi:hypothetical protein